MADRSRLFLVVRIGWKVHPWDNSNTATATYAAPEGLDRNGETRLFIPVAGFVDRPRAEQHAWQLELEAARLFNPFWRLGHSQALTNLSEAVFLDKLRELVGSVPNVTPENPSEPIRAWSKWWSGRMSIREWSAWWDESMPNWSDEALSGVWKLFDQIRFYDVVEVAAES